MLPKQGPLFCAECAKTGGICLKEQKHVNVNQELCRTCENLNFATMSFSCFVFFGVNERKNRSSKEPTRARARTKKHNFWGRSKKLLGAPGIATRRKHATRGSWPYY